VPRLKRRCKTPDYADRAVFGVPLTVSRQRHAGQPLPPPVLLAMRRLRRAAADAVGVFRKSAVRSRVAALRHQLELDPGRFRHPALHCSATLSQILSWTLHSVQSVMVKVFT